MNWYYADGTQQVGPVTEEQFNSLVASGKITPDTLVWRDGLADWKPLKDIRSAAGGSAAAPSGAPMEGGVVCSQCQQIFPQDQVIKYGDQSVCASCKPAFVQRLKEGASVTGDMEYAGFWIRLVAKVLDSLIVGVPVGLIMAMVMGAGKNSSEDGIVLVQALLQLVFYAGALFLNIFFVGKFGATPGKMACGLRIVRSDGSKVSYGRATGRAFAEIVSGMVCYIGFIMAAFDDEKRTLHDRMVDTRVIKK